MTSLDRTSEMDHVEAAFHYGGLVLRAVGYLVLFAIADNYDFGRALLTGVLAGDLLGQALKILTSWRHGLVSQVCELLFIGLVYLLTHHLMLWPNDAAMSAIAGLSALGVVSGHVGGSLLTRLGPTDSWG